MLTPGQNVKRYIAGAMDALTDRVMWVKGERKNSRLFIELLRKLLVEYRDKEVIHLVLDNYTMHSSKQTRLWLSELGQRIRLHFLPPYCPDDNRIERKVWREVHANANTPVVGSGKSRPMLIADVANVGKHLGMRFSCSQLRPLYEDMLYEKGILQLTPTFEDFLEFPPCKCRLRCPSNLKIPFL